MLKRIIYYRGALCSCNYSCHYCPFALKKNSRFELQKDKTELNRFIDWLSQQNNSLSYGIMFTPWGEAMIRKYYQQAFIALSFMPHVHKVCAQTNLSGDVSWLKECCHDSSALWISYHPQEVSFTSFVNKCDWLYQHNISYSVGMVGLKEYLPAMKNLRKALPDDVYLWINAFKDKEDYYQEEDINAMLNIDPLFHLNLNNYECLGQPCDSGQYSFLVGQGGGLYRCHFIKHSIGNLYKDKLVDILKSKPCPNKLCECYLGYMHLKQNDLYTLFGERFLERIPINIQ